MATEHHCYWDPFLAQVVCRDEVEVPGDPGEPGDGGAGDDAPNGIWVTYPVVSTGPDGAPCIGTSGEWAADEDEADAIRLAQGREFFFIYERDAADGPIANCPDAGPGAPGVPPQTLRARVQTLLPDFDPWIAPGWGLTGQRAYLETRGTLRFGPQTLTLDFEVLTLDIEIDASSRFTVDWGEGTVTGPIEDVGAPWPHGAISHVYTHTGIYDVVITQTWTVRYRPATAPPAPPSPWSELTVDLTRTIEDFDVDQVQPVRRR
jgi:hypothetical protein